MFKWLDRWFTRKVQEVMAESKPDKSDDDDFDLWFEEKSQKKKAFSHANGMTFTIYPARGGLVVEYTQYNDRTQEMDHDIHIITTDQDVGDALSKIITIQQLIK